jgi:tripartite-type tricarboxylate transporter receptor subunit TctC
MTARHLRDIVTRKTTMHRSKRLLLGLVVVGVTSVQAAEIITVVSGAAPTHSAAPLAQRTMEEANKLQSKYAFVLEYKPGAQGVIAVQHMDRSPHNRIAGIAPSFVENVRAGQLKEEDYLPVSAQGDACWALISNVGSTADGVASLQSLKGQEIVVGGTGFGNATHLTSLILAERYGFKVKYIVFKSNFDGLVNMVGEHGVNLVIDRIQSYQQFKTRQPKLQVLGINCTQRSDLMPEVKTLREQGFDTPMIFNLFIANRSMPEEKRREIGRILDQSQQIIGRQAMMERADLLAPQFSKVSIDEFFKQRIGLIKTLADKYNEQIETSK